MKFSTLEPEQKNDWLMNPVTEAFKEEIATSMRAIEVEAVNVLCTGGIPAPHLGGYVRALRSVLDLLRGA